MPREEHEFVSEISNIEIIAVGSAIRELAMNAKFVMCIDNENYPIDLTVHMVYKIVYDESADKRGWIRVVDNTGEEYLYSARKFVPVQIPKEAEQSFGMVAA
jgi:uncharacterized protein (UPF0303 family)